MIGVRGDGGPHRTPACMDSAKKGDVGPASRPSLQEPPPSRPLAVLWPRVMRASPAIPEEGQLVLGDPGGQGWVAESDPSRSDRQQASPPRGREIPRNWGLPWSLAPPRQGAVPHPPGQYPLDLWLFTKLAAILKPPLFRKPGLIGAPLKAMKVRG